MTQLSSRLTIVALAACTSLSALVSACAIDEPATFIPRSGTWTYAEQSVVSNTCNNVKIPDPLSTFVLDYDEGDEFQIELGAEDALCEIDGEEFYCAEYELGESGFPGTDAVFRMTVRWEGEFSSETVATGHEITTVTCTGEDCAMVQGFPCSQDTTFSAEFFN
ncbi:hypothetical protein DB30_05501 [Enhygromyxa salina]|uniref:Lipoprotein n=1 Tax=Enhygromyxa salina TaxID=215803 RepID=A0A0C1ZWP8_9BACT|nr:hypothetical protein [Enhygromyxa salina]KIG15478.1 hypothetical protein DB30_05501 [Enhygromyxa salina]